MAESAESHLDIPPSENPNPAEASEQTEAGAGNEQEASRIYPFEAVWHSAGSDRPVRVVGSLGLGPDGKEYLQIEGTNTGIDADKISNLGTEVSETSRVESTTPQYERGDRVRVYVDRDGERVPEDDWEYRGENEGNITAAKNIPEGGLTEWQHVPKPEFDDWQRERVATEAGELATEETVEIPPGAQEVVNEEHEENLGYDDPAKLEQAHHLGISHDALNKGRELGYSLDLLITAVNDDHKELLKYLTEKGIRLPGELPPDNENVLPIESRDEKRVLDRQAARVISLYPSPPGNPHVITKSEVHYLEEKIQEAPSWLRRSLIRPGSLPVPKALYLNPASRLVLDVINTGYCRIGQRLLAGRLYRSERARNPNEDYGMLGFGRAKRHTALEHIKLVDKTIKRDRYALSRRRRHSFRGDIRTVARLDLAQSLAEIRRDQQAFGMNRLALPSEQ
jgi:hypothetical protein